MRKGKAKKIGNVQQFGKIPNLKRKILKNRLILTNLALWTSSNIRKIWKILIPVYITSNNSARTTMSLVPVLATTRL